MAGNIVVIEATDNFQKVSRQAINNPKINPTTLGVYVDILSLSKEWNLNVKGLAKILNISADKVRTAFAELEAAGFLRRTHTKNDKGHFTSLDYVIYSDPQDALADGVCPTSEKSNVGEIQRWENPMLENSNVGEMTHYIETNKGNNRLENKCESVGGAEAPAAPQGADAPSLEDKEKKDKHPSLKEIQAFCQEKGYTIDTLQFYSYYESNGWMVGKAKMKNWKAAVVNWYCRDKKEGKVATTTPIPSQPQQKKDPEHRNPYGYTDKEYADFLKYQEAMAQQRAEKEAKEKAEAERLAATPIRERMKTFRITPTTQAQ